MEKRRFRQDAFVSGLRKRRHTQKSLGMAYDQRFYAMRFMPGQSLAFPFDDDHFNALITVCRPVDEEVLRSVSLQLLERGMRVAVCHGEDSDRLCDITDDLIDEHDFRHEGCTVFAQCHEDEPLEDVIDYFILPNDLAEVGLLVVLGEETDFEQVVSLFSDISSGVNEAFQVTAG